MSVTLDQVYKAMHSQLTWNIGTMIGILITGGLLSFGTSCIFLLSGQQDPETLKQHRLLRVYIVTLLILVTSHIVMQVIQSNVLLIFDVHSPLGWAERPDPVAVFFNTLIPTFVFALTDGLLVWRCYIIQKLSLCHDPSQWKKAFWILPASLWSLTIVTGCISAPLGLVSSHISIVLEVVALFSNVVLNIYATLFISIRLLNHRRMMVRIVGQNVDTSRYMTIVSILLESAAINVPITIAVAVGKGLRAFFGTIILPIVIAGQALASVIIIYQVAVGRAFGRKQEEELSQFVVEKRISGNFHEGSTDTASMTV